MQNTPTLTPHEGTQQEAMESRARLDALPALIREADKRGGRDASRLVRTEKGYLDEYVPVLESQTHSQPFEARQAETAQAEQELFETQTTLRFATQLSHAASECLEWQETEANKASAHTVKKAQKWSTAEMHTAHHALESQRIKLDQLQAGNSSPHADLSELPALIEADIEQGKIETDQPLPSEKGPAYIPEAEAEAYYCQGLKAQIAQEEQNLIEAEAAFQITLQANEKANKALEIQEHPLNEALTIAKYEASAYMSGAHQSLKKQRLDLAKLRAALREDGLEKDEKT